MNIVKEKYMILLDVFFSSVNKFWLRYTFQMKNYILWCQANSCMLYDGTLMKEVLSCSTCFSADKFSLMPVVMNCIFLRFIRILICKDFTFRTVGNVHMMVWVSLFFLVDFFLNSCNSKSDELINLSELECDLKIVYIIWYFWCDKIFII